MVRGTEVAQKEGKAEQQMGGAEAEKGEEKGRAEEEAGVRVGREETEVGTEQIEDTDLLFFKLVFPAYRTRGKRKISCMSLALSVK